MADRTLKYRDLLKLLKRFGVVEDKGRGKGSERMLIRMVGGVKHCIATKCHHEGDQKPRGVIAAIRRRLLLTPEHGITDKDFYGS